MGERAIATAVKNMDRGHNACNKHDQSKALHGAMSKIEQSPITNGTIKFSDHAKAARSAATIPNSTETFMRSSIPTEEPAVAAPQGGIVRWVDTDVPTPDVGVFATITR
jgi:hypothetical protein